MQKIHEVLTAEKLEEVNSLLKANMKKIWQDKYYRAWLKICYQEKIEEAKKLIPKNMHSKNEIKAWINLVYPEWEEWFKTEILINETN